MSSLAISAMTIAAALAAEPKFDAHRTVTLDAQLSKIVVELMRPENHQALYEACHVRLVDSETESVRFFPPPMKVIRRSKVTANVLLKRVYWNCSETFEATHKHALMVAELTEAGGDLERFSLQVAFYPDEQDKTRAELSLTFEVRDVGKMLDRSVARLTLKWLAEGLREMVSKMK